VISLFGVTARAKNIIRQLLGLLTWVPHPLILKGADFDFSPSAMNAPINKLNASAFPHLGIAKSSLRREWRAQGDDFRTFLSDFVSSLTRLEPSVVPG